METREFERKRSLTVSHEHYQPKIDYIFLLVKILVSKIGLITVFVPLTNDNYVARIRLMRHESRLRAWIVSVASGECAEVECG